MLSCEDLDIEEEGMEEERRNQYKSICFADRRKNNGSIYLQKLQELIKTLPSEPSGDVFEDEKIFSFYKMKVEALRNG